ncbi:MAG: peptidylprolyl isomerase [Desulfomonilia bacterium]|uniref:Peptidylprolyl isomerase n=1 Tax=anaerobic digester metagenome TaxID=1263854 RepID=A0A485M1Q3_9ZZZZ|nr:peptidylprolyl isomerase [Pseudomonadota bacterium]HPD22630.1 peptidylprolyl isomerase [Deltaproteobacteria bacterium]HPX19013.1 peptidylprolyl isomerase [Deltaproteobacteria bacterium]HRS57448.1 peptidylprolyl isomerase [Desulfomonilia bacterium]HRV36965.1 peptidylprolyl isomerase [Desulfomonilia bacterium]
MKKLIVSVMVLMAAIAGCTAENTASMAGKVDMNDPHLVAVVGGEKIMDTDIEALLNEIPEQARQRYASVEGKRELVQSLAEIKMLSLEAKKQGIDRSPDVKRKIDFMGEQMLARELAENTVDKITISDEEISGYYHDNREQFSTGPRVKLRHILLDSESEAQAVLARLKKGEDFSALAREKSRCPSSQQGGELGWATKGMMVPEFEDAAFALKKGQMSEVVKSSYGYHVIMCDDVEAARQLDLEEVRDTIRQQLKSEKSEETVSALIEQAKKNHPVTVNEEYFRKAGEEAQAAPGDETSASGEGDVGAGGQIEGE